MGETQPGPALVSYRDGVTELIEAGEPVGAVEDAIDTSAGLTEDARAVLRMRAFSMCDPEARLQRARAHPAALA
jgi:hypothetical protein